jgi:sorbitol-specific phosphotransferase system component IIC
MPTRTELRIEVSDPILAHSLGRFLEHSVYQPAPPEGEIVSVTVPEGLSPQVARAELDLYLGAWSRLHPDVSVSLID